MNGTISHQLRVLREQRGLTQAALAKRVNMTQERISILENPKAKSQPSLRTLQRLAKALEVRLEVRFVREYKQ